MSCASPWYSADWTVLARAAFRETVAGDADMAAIGRDDWIGLAVAAFRFHDLCGEELMGDERDGADLEVLYSEYLAARVRSVPG